MTGWPEILAGDIAVRARSGRAVYVWGAGEGGRRAAAVIGAAGAVVTALVDSDPAKAGRVVDGLVVVGPDEVLTRQPRPRVVVASMYWRDIAARLRRDGFRSGRDFDVYPVDGVGDVPLPGWWSGAAAHYETWRREWLAAEGYGGPGSGTAVRILAWPGRASRGSTSASVPPRLAGERWIVVHDAAAGRVRWRWRSPEPDGDVQAADAIYDWTAARAGRRPFVLRAVGQATTLAAPLLCRAWIVQAYLAAPHHEPSIRGLRAWLKARGITVAPAAGACEARIPAAAPAALGESHAGDHSPGLVAYVAATARTGQPAFAADELAAVLPQWSRGAVADRGLSYLRAMPRRGRRRPRVLSVLAHSQGNFFFTEIRDFLAQAWRRVGLEVRVGDERSAPADLPRPHVIVAPHEFFALDGRLPAWDPITDAVLVNTEQPQTSWFARGFERLLASPLILDLNWQTTALLRALGANAHFLPLGYDGADRVVRPRRRLPARPAFAGMAAAERRLPALAGWSERPIDVLFVGTLSQRRAAALAAVAPALARHRCFLHLPPSSRPITAASGDALDARDMADLCRRAKIVLNLHRDEMPYCEWHRVVFQAMRHGALVVSEPMLPVPAFAPGRDFVEARVADLPAMLTRLLDTGAGRQSARRMAARGRQTLARRFPAARVARAMWGLL